MRNENTMHTQWNGYYVHIGCIMDAMNRIEIQSEYSQFQNEHNGFAIVYWCAMSFNESTMDLTLYHQMKTTSKSLHNFFVDLLDNC